MSHSTDFNIPDRNKNNFLTFSARFSLSKTISKTNKIFAYFKRKSNLAPPVKKLSFEERSVFDK